VKEARADLGWFAKTLIKKSDSYTWVGKGKRKEEERIPLE